MAKVGTIVNVICAIVVVLHFNNEGVKGDESWYRKYLAVVDDVSSMIDWNETDFPGRECWDMRQAGIPPLGHELTFPCTVHPPSDEIPTSAHRVRVADIKVVGAMGDSLSAGNGANACILPEVAIMARGRIYSHGGDSDFTTNPSLTNILLKYNPNLKGYGVERGNWDSENAGLNVAYPGDKANDMPHQAEWLIQKMKADTTIDFENDWKVVTLFIGGNDLCAWCNNLERYSSDNYVSYIREALMILHDNMPRVIVNVIQILQVYQVDLMRAPICNFFHMSFCSCGTFLTDEELAAFEAINKEYQVKLNADIMSGQYDDKEDFTVVLQTFLEETSVPFLSNGEPDFSYFAPDCFHFSAKGHAQSGIELWKNMLEPVGQKTKEWNPEDTTIVCPPEDFPYIYTNLNSKPEFWDPIPTTPDSSVSAMTPISGVLFQLVLAFLTALFYHV